jgi:ABC-type dipeptide/oligopeptide/nickel transport system permease subunit
MISEAASYVTAAPWMLFGPAGAIVLSVVSVNLVGDFLQEWIGLRMRRAVSHV